MFGFLRQRARPVPPLDQRIMLAVEERELLRLGDEALRDKRPELAHYAYWRAAQIYASSKQPSKTLAVLNAILRFAPADANALVLRVQTLDQLGRRRDAALAARESATLLVSHGDHARASWCTTRAEELEPAPLPAIY